MQESLARGSDLQQGPPAGNGAPLNPRPRFRPSPFLDSSGTACLSSVPSPSSVQLTLARERKDPPRALPVGPHKPGSITLTRGDRCLGLPSAPGALPSAVTPAFSFLSVLPRRASRYLLWGSPSPPGTRAVGAPVSCPPAAESEGEETTLARSGAATRREVRPARHSDHARARGAPCSDIAGRSSVGA